MKLSIYTKIGIGLIVLSAILFVIAASLFTFRGNVTPFIRTLSEITFISWLPTFVIGGFILAFRLVNRLIKKDN